MSKWFEVLLPKILPYLHGNGGPVILIQLENSYGSSKTINEQYKSWLRNEVGGFHKSQRSPMHTIQIVLFSEKYVGSDTILITSDSIKRFKQGKIKGVPVALAFRSTSGEMIDFYWKNLRATDPHNPLINIEFMTGNANAWCDVNKLHWFFALNFRWNCLLGESKISHSDLQNSKISR